MLRRYGSGSDAVSLQAELIDETSGALSWGILKDRASVRERQGLAPPAIAIEPSHFLPDLRCVPLHGAKRGLHDNALGRQTGEPVPHGHIVWADLGQPTIGHQQGHTVDDIPHTSH